MFSHDSIAYLSLFLYLNMLFFDLHVLLVCIVEEKEAVESVLVVLLDMIPTG